MPHIILLVLIICQFYETLPNVINSQKKARRIKIEIPFTNRTYRWRLQLLAILERDNLPNADSCYW